MQTLALPSSNPSFEPNAFSPVAGRRCVSRSDIRSMFHALYEVPTDAIAHLLPRGVKPFEPKPGLAVYDIGHIHWNSGNMGGAWPAFHELTMMLLVHPDLSIDMPVPKFCFFLLRVASNHAAFVESEAKMLHLPAVYSPIFCEKTVNPVGVSISDGNHSLFHLKSTQTNPVYHQDDFWGQYLSVDDGQLWLGIWRWEGIVCEHQRAGDSGFLRNHELLHGKLDVETLTPELYMQMFTQPASSCVETFYEPMMLKSL